MWKCANNISAARAFREKEQKRDSLIMYKIFLMSYIPFNSASMLSSSRRAFIIRCLYKFICGLYNHIHHRVWWVCHKIPEYALMYGVYRLKIISHNWDVIRVWCAVRWKLLFHEIIKDDELLISDDYQIEDDQSNKLIWLICSWKNLANS